MKLSSLFRRKKASNQKDTQKKPFFNQTNDTSIQKKEQDTVQRAMTPEEDDMGTNTQRIEEDKAIQEKTIQRMGEGEEEEAVQMMGHEEEEGVQMQSMEEEEPIQAKSKKEGASRKKNS